MNKSKKKFIMLPLVLLLTIVPLIVHMYEYSSHLGQYDWYPSNDMTADFFLYYKSVMITVISAAMCIVLAWRYGKKKKDFKWTYQLLPLAIYALWVVISTLFSQYKYFSFHGTSEMFETVWVLLGYCVMTFYAYQVIHSLEDLDCVMKWLTIGLLVMLTLGIFQALGFEFFSTRIGKMLITNPSYWDNLDSIGVIFEKGRVFLTLYNPNYVASYFSLMIPIEIALIIRSEKIGYRILYIVMTIVSFICLLGSGNRSGIFAFVLTIILVAVILNRKLLKGWRIVLPGMLVIAAIVGIYISRNNMIIEKFVRLFSQQETEAATDAISEIITGDNDVAITYNGEVLHISYISQTEGYLSIYMTDDNGADISTTLAEDSSTYTIVDERFAGITVQAIQLTDIGVGLNVYADGHNWYFVKGEDETYYFYNAYGKLDKINNAPRVAVDWLEQKFEERGTIWSKTIPMLKNRIVFGTGADTFTVVYPQDDYVDKTYDGSTASIDVKPHNLYLQIAIQSGIPALIAFLVLYGWYFVIGMRLYPKATYQDPMEIIGVGLYFSLFTYMVVSILNDSVVAVAPVFWIMLGLGIATNEILQKKMLQDK